MSSPSDWPPSFLSNPPCRLWLPNFLAASWCWVEAEKLPGKVAISVDVRAMPCARLEQNPLGRLGIWWCGCVEGRVGCSVAWDSAGGGGGGGGSTTGLYGMNIGYPV